MSLLSDEMVQQGQELSDKPDDQIPRTYKGEGELAPTGCVLTSTLMSWHLYARARVCARTHTPPSTK